MKWAFVDYENVNSLELLRLSDYEWVVLFCGPKDKKLKIDLSTIESGKSPRLEIIRLDKSAKNNLDFHLALYLGRYHETVEEAAEFSVVSNDTGFDGVIAYLKNLGRKCKRIKDKPAAAKKSTTVKKATPAKKAAVKKAAAKKATAKKATEKPAKKSTAKEVPKESVAKKAVKIAKPKTTTAKRVKANETQSLMSLPKLKEARADALIKLKKTPENNLPAKESALLRWFENALNINSGEAQQLMASMTRINYFTVSEGRMSYHFE